MSYLSESAVTISTLYKTCLSSSVPPTPGSGQVWASGQCDCLCHLWVNN